MKIVHDRVHDEIEIDVQTARTLFVASFFIGPLATFIMMFKTAHLDNKMWRSLKNVVCWQFMLLLVFVGYFYSIYTCYCIYRNSK